MSTVYIHVGQCGNQIGQEFWTRTATLSLQCPNTRRVLWTPGGPGRDQGGHIRGVFIDGERKVLQKLYDLSRRKAGREKLKFGHGNLLSSAKGCGSNWAMGFHKMPTEKVVSPWKLNAYSYSYEFDYGEDNDVLKASMESIRHEVEACDCFSGFVTCHSLGGGTGSGFGSRLAVELRDRYPIAFQLNLSIAPHSTGDSPTQYYNETLCMASLQKNVDAIVLFENDDILELLLNDKFREAKTVNYEDLNSYISECITNLLMPVSSLSPRPGTTVGIEPWELIRSVTPMHNLKLLNCRYVQDTSSKTNSLSPWNKLTQRICQQTRTKTLRDCSDSTNKKIATLAAACVCRNVDRNGANFEVDIAKLATDVKKSYRCVSWNPFPVDIWIDERKSVLGKTGQVLKNPNLMKSLSICSNLSSLATMHCSQVLAKAELKYKARAYLHWYERYGTDRSDFEEAFEIMRTVITDYGKMTLDS